MRKPYIAGNWKMNTTLTEGIQLCENICNLVTNISTTDIAIFPPSTHLATLKAQIKNTQIQIGSQNISDQKEGAFTGEISAKMIQDIGCKSTLIGHSERRQLYKESNKILAQKCTEALRNNLQIVFCIGETLEERESEQTLPCLETQLTEGLISVKNQLSANNLIIAYEPVWAIGTGKVASTEQAQEAHAFIRHFLSSWHSPTLGKETRILYGGSVKPSNSQDLLSQEDIDGALIGGASLNAESFNQIIQSI